MTPLPAQRVLGRLQPRLRDARKLPGGAAYDHEISQAVTCDQIMDSFTSSGSNLAGKDFSSAFSCMLCRIRTTSRGPSILSRLLLRHRRRAAQCVLGGLQPHLRGPYPLDTIGRVGGRQASNGNTAASCQQVMDYSTEDGKTLYGDDFSSASTAAESCTYPIYHQRRPWCHRGQVLRLRQLCLPRHRRLRHVGRPRRFGGRRGVRFRRSLGISLKGPLRDVPPPSSICN